MGSEDEETLRADLARLRQDHRDLDAKIGEQVETGWADHLELRRLKKQKLALKDRISQIEDKLLPDIIA